ncbi:MAG TPA: hypothetical protein VIK14_03305 [Ignavibacteria bacterium]
MKYIRFFVIVFAILLFGKFLLANSGPMEYFSGGSLRPMSGEHKSIQMKSELVEMYLYGGYYRVIATFYFDNIGDSTTVIMGFPENYSTDMFVKYVNIKDSVSGFNSVKSFVDGEEVEIKRYSLDRVYTKSSDFFNTFQTYWVKKVKFEKNQKRKVVVDYTVNNDYSFGMVEYNFTGGNWYKNVEHSKLVIYPVGVSNPPKPYPKDVRFEEGKYIFEKFNWEADYAFEWTGFVKSIFESTLTKNGIYDVFRGEIKEYTYLSFYLFKDYLGNILYISPINFIFPPYKFQDIHHTMRHYTEDYPGNILRIDRKGYSNGEHYLIADFIDQKKSFKPEYSFNYVKYFESENLYLFKTNIGKSIFFYIRKLKTSDYIRYTGNEPEDKDSIKIIMQRDQLGKDPYRNEDIFYLSESNSFSLDSQITNNYSYFEKFLTPGEYLDNLEAYVLQMIFIGKEEEAWKYFDEHFPLLCRKQKSKDLILETKQKIIKLKSD